MKTDGELYLCGNSNRNKMYYLPQSGDNGKRYHIIQSMFFFWEKILRNGISKGTSSSRK